MRKKELQERITELENKVNEKDEAFVWAMETAAKLLKLKIPTNTWVSWEDKSDRYCPWPRKVFVCRLTVCGKSFYPLEKNDRNKLEGFLEHYEMLQEAKNKKK